MLVSMPLHLDTLPGKPTAQDLEAVLTRLLRQGRERLGGADHCRRRGRRTARARRAERHGSAWNCGCSPTRAISHAVLVARLDNLGKGASGAAVQNIRLMLGIA